MNGRKPSLALWYGSVRTGSFRLITACLVIAVSIFTGETVGSASADQSKRNPTKDSVKTTVPRISYTKLKSQAEFAIASGGVGWVLVAMESIVVPDLARAGLDRIDPKTNKSTEGFTGVAQPCSGAIEAFGSIWAPDCQDGTIARIEPTTGKIDARPRTGVARVPVAVSASPDSVWALTDEKTTLTRIDPDTNQVVAELRLPSGCNSLSFGEASLWATCPKQDLLLKIDTARNLIEQRVKVSGEPSAMAIGEGSIWVLCRKAGGVERIDPKTNQSVKTIDLGLPEANGSIAIGYGSVWVSVPGVPITRIDLQTDRVVQQFSGDAGGILRVGFGSVWLINARQNTLSRIDPRRIAATLPD